MTRFVVTCPTCGNISECVYRCDDESCGADLANTDSPVWTFAWPSVAGIRDDGLAAVEIPFECVSCDAPRWLSVDYQHIGRVIRTGCSTCERPTKHRPVEEDLRRAAPAAIGRTAAQFADHNPPFSTP